MTADLKKTIKNFSDEYLLEQFYREKDQYTPEALSLMEKEIALRDIADEKKNAYTTPEPSGQHYDQESFVSLDNTFSRADMMLVSSILSENDIPFYAKGTAPSDIVPIETEANKTYTVFIPPEQKENARETIEEHFEESSGLYTRKELGTIDKLKSVNFYELRIPESQLEETVQVTLTPREKEIISAYAQRVIDNVGPIEEKLERPLFFYDNIEELIDLLKEDNPEDLDIAHILAILEVVQIFCEDEDFQKELEQTIQSLLEFIETILKK
ncbi:MAG: hypothetical protein GF401_11310 [Chitinivibrionales bacterium]|nr:hypothetical protein [Chitinivibrionales bacterium]